MTLEGVFKGNRFITEMLLGCILVMLPHKKRAHFAGRAAAFCLAAELISALVMNFAPIKRIWQNQEVISSCVYVVVFAALSLLFLNVCCPLTRQEAIYGAALCLCAQHFSSSLLIVVRSVVPWHGELSEALTWLLTIVIPYGLFYSLCFRRICRHGAYHVSDLHLINATCLIFLISAVISIVAKGFHSGDNAPLFVIVQIYEMLCCLFLLWMQVYQVKTEELQRGLGIQDYLQHLRQEQFIQSHRDMNLMTHLMHELKHQIADMVTAGTDALKEDLLERIGENLQIYDETIDTKNETLNMVLMERRLFCRENHINWMVVADGEQLGFLDAGDIYLIFRNALDNAIESVVQLEDPQRRIVDVRVCAQHGFLMIQIENAFKGERQFVDALPLTTKGDRTYHGFGLKAIAQIAEKYDGQLSVRTQGHRFTLQIMIPMPRPHHSPGTQAFSGEGRP